ncbi:MAG: hypothetical protein ACOYUK_04780 [Patescibacteria group bacterium]
MNKKYLVIPLFLIILFIGVGIWWKLDQKENAEEINSYLQQRIPTDFLGKTSVEISGLLPNDPSTTNIATQADIIVQGQVQKIEKPYKTAQGEVYHSVVLKLEKIYKSNENIKVGKEITVAVEGGETEEAWYWGMNIPSFEESESVILFLGQVDQEGIVGEYYVNYGSFGKLSIENGVVRGINHEDGAVETSLDSYQNKLEQVVADSK